MAAVYEAFGARSEYKASPGPRGFGLLSMRVNYARHGNCRPTISLEVAIF